MSGSCIGWAPEETQPVPGKLRFLLPVVIEFDSAGAGEESQNSVEDIEDLQWRAKATSGVQSLKSKINSPLKFGDLLDLKMFYSVGVDVWFG